MKRLRFGVLVLIVGLSAVIITGLMLSSTNDAIAQGHDMQNMPGMNMSKSKPKGRKKRTAAKKRRPANKRQIGLRLLFGDAITPAVLVRLTT